MLVYEGIGCRMTKLQPCLHCKNKKILVAKENFGDYVYCFCAKCGVCGPRVNVRRPWGVMNELTAAEKAIDTWNKFTRIKK